LPSTWWCSSWSVSAGMLFFDLLCGGIMSCFSAETRWAPMLGVSEIPDETPEHKRKSASTSKFTDDARGDKESPKDCSSLKSCESFYTCPRTPFYWETKGLLHSKSTLESKEYS
jgi:hypothetical protein